MFNVLSRQDQSTLMTLIGALYELDAGSRNPGSWTLFAGNSLGSYVSFTSGPVPCFAWYYDQNQMVIFITGATIPAQGVGLLQGAFVQMLRLDGVQYNSYLQSAISAILGSLGTKQIFLPASLVIVGHSFGGAIAQALAANLGLGAPTGAVNVLTFGSPRAGDASLASFLDGITTVRIMNVGDPIPFFPPHFDEAPVGTIAVGFATALALSKYEHSGGGYVLDSAGNLTAAVLPPSLFPIKDATLLAWALNQSSFSSTEHWYRTYVSRMAAGSLTLGPLPPPTSAGLKGEIEPLLTQPIFNLGPVLGPVALNGGAVVATISVFIPLANRARVVKVGPNYNVSWGPGVIATGFTKSNAKTLAKYLNKFLRVMQTVKSVDHTQFGNALQYHLTAASSAGAGFMPVLTVT